MLAKSLRLNLAIAKWRYRGADLQIATPNFKIIAKRTGKQSRFGFLVTSKVGTAVVRNRAKRWLAEAVGERLEKFPTGFDFIFIAYPQIAQGSYEKVGASLDQVLPKLSFSR